MDTNPLAAAAAEMLADVRTGRNDQHVLVGFVRQPVFGRRAGYADMHAAERLRNDSTVVPVQPVRRSGTWGAFPHRYVRGDPNPAQGGRIAGSICY